MKKYSLSLHLPDRRIIGALQEAYEVTYTRELGDFSLLSFKIPLHLTIKHKRQKNIHIPYLVEGNLIQFTFLKKISYFVIQKVAKSHDDSGDECHVDCSELPFLLSKRQLVNYKATSKNATQLLNDVLQNTTWRVGSIHGDYNVSYRSIEYSGNILDAIYSIANTFEALCLFDSDEKTVHLHHPDHYKFDHGHYVGYGKLIDNITYESDNSEQITRLMVRGKDGLQINSVSATGASYLENYTYHYDRMSAGLSAALINWDNQKKSLETVFSSQLSQLETQRALLVTKEGEHSDLKTELDLIVARLDIENSRGGTVSSILAEKLAKENEILAKQTEITTVRSSIASITSEITVLSSSLQISNHLTQNQIAELDAFIFEGEYSNEYVSDPITLKELAIKHFDNMLEPKLMVNIGLVNLFGIMGFEENHDYTLAELGTVITIRYDKSDIHVKAKIIKNVISFEDENIDVTISNFVKAQTSGDKWFEQQKKSYSFANSYSANKYAYDNNLLRTDEVSQILNSTWDSVNRQITGGVNNSITITGRGIVTTDVYDRLRMTIIQNSVIGLSKDGGNTWKTALTPDGIIAEQLQGQIILGNALAITNPNGSFTADANGVTVKELDLAVTRSDTKSRILISPADGFKVQKNIGTTSTPTWSDQITLNSDGDGVLKGKIEIGSGNAIFKADGQGIYLGHNSFGSAPFSVDLTGKIKANNVELTGGKIEIGDKFKVDNLGNATMRDANISGNINMTGGSISWGNVGKPGYSAAEVGAVANNQNAVFQTLTNGGTLKGLFMSNNDLYINADYLQSGTIKGINIEIGELDTNNVFKATSSGISLGHQNFENARFRVSNSGELVATNAKIHGNLSTRGTSGAGVVLSTGWGDIEVYNSANNIIFRVHDEAFNMSTIDNPSGDFSVGRDSGKVFAKGNWEFKGNVTGIFARFA